MSLLIKNVRILGGSGNTADNAGSAAAGSDVFVVNDKIAAIGNFPDKKADEVLDGQGAYLSPGFIDVNTDSDHYLTLFEHPEQDDFLRQGVTTIFGGMCGSSLAPLLYGTLESVRKWGGSEDRINIDWHTVAEFLETLDKRPLAVNFGTLAGHGTIRRALTGSEGVRALTKNEIAVFLETLKQSLDGGAFGISTNLGSVHAEKTSASEIKALAKFVADRGGVYASHLRKTEAGIAGAVDETIKLSDEVGVSTLISHFVPVRGSEKEYSAALDAIEALPDTSNFHFDIYPFDSLLLPFYTFLPEWVRLGGFEVMLANIQEEWLLPKMIKEMAPITLDRLTVAQAPGNEFLVGKSLGDLCEMYGLRDGREALLRLMVTTKMRGVALYKNIDEKLMKRAITSKRALIASNAPSFGSITEATSERQLKSDRTTRTFLQFLELAEKENIMPLADAVRKITYEPARKFGLLGRPGVAGRGEIKEGNFADLACFRNGEVKFTIVNGKVAIKEGEFQGKFPGKALRHS